MQLSGQVVRQPEKRVTPAGIPITRLVLEHVSQQTEAGLQREAGFRILLVCTGTALAAQAEALQLDQQLLVEGFITRENYRDADRRLALHVQHMTLMGVNGRPE